MFKTERQILDDMARSIYRLRKAGINTLFDDFNIDLKSFCNENGFFDRKKISESDEFKNVLRKLGENLKNLDYSDIDESNVKNISDKLADALGVSDIKIIIKTPENEKTLNFFYDCIEKTNKNKNSDFNNGKNENTVNQDARKVENEMELSSEISNLFEDILGLTEKNKDVESEVDDDNKCDINCNHNCVKCNFINPESEGIESDEKNLFEMDFEALNRTPLTNSELKERIFNGENLEDIFDGIGQWYNGHARVSMEDGKYNLLNTKMNLLSDVWYNYVSEFEDDYAIVEQNHVYNVINKNGDLISEQWYDWIDYFYEGFAVVYLGDKCNFIDKNGNRLSCEWFDKAYRFNSGLAEVFINDNIYFIDTDGNIQSPTEEHDENILEEDKKEQITERKRYLLLDVGGDFNVLFYNAVQYICETVHFPNSDFYTYKDELDLDLHELDGVILLPNVWGKMLDYYVDKYSDYINDNGKLYVINTESFELTSVKDSLELENYKMNNIQQNLLIRR